MSTSYPLRESGHQSGERAYKVGPAVVRGRRRQGLIGHAGAVLLRRLADRTGLTVALAAVRLAVAIVLGAVNLSDAEQLQAHHQGLFGPAVSDSTTSRTLEVMDEEVLKKIARVRAQARRGVWSLLHLQPGDHAAPASRVGKVHVSVPDPLSSDRSEGDLLAARDLDEPPVPRSVRLGHQGDRRRKKVGDHVEVALEGPCFRT
ncbi:hypothetical protein OH738_16945 [Streptomyces hirsutus]|uniref:hypothetical protein n=1 Tax=Streptomyces hirsutus TaxID=35620 RepID=UPI003869D08E|nr:hypothetical protein OH738_16945 [Streptomyces hirsutus]